MASDNATPKETLKLHRFRLAVLACCLLAFWASCDEAVVPQLGPDPASSASQHDDDEATLPVRGQSARQRCPERPPAALAASHPLTSLLSLRTPPLFGPAAGEHRHRNGTGTPLLC